MLNLKDNRKVINNYIEEWLQGIKISCKQSTYSSYEYTLKARIIPYFGNLKLCDINENLINNYTWSLLEQNLEVKTIKDTLIILKQILNYAGVDISIKMPKLKKKEVNIINKLDQQSIEKELLSNINEINVGIYLCLYTGLRIGEICALKWENINLDKCTISVKKTLIRVKNYDIEDDKKTKVILDEPKSYSSIRDIPIPVFIVPILKEIKKNNDYFFLTSSIKYMEPRNYRNHYKRFLKDINITNNYSFHALRHTFATRCIESGCDPKTLSEILGHSNVNITLDRYVHPNLDSKIKMMNSLCPMV